MTRLGSNRSFAAMRVNGRFADKAPFRCSCAKVSLSEASHLLLFRSDIITDAIVYRSASTARPTKTNEMPTSVCKEKVSLPAMTFKAAIRTRLE